MFSHTMIQAYLQQVYIIVHEWMCLQNGENIVHLKLVP